MSAASADRNRPPKPKKLSRVRQSGTMEEGSDQQRLSTQEDGRLEPGCGFEENRPRPGAQPGYVLREDRRGCRQGQQGGGMPRVKCQMGLVVPATGAAHRRRIRRLAAAGLGLRSARMGGCRPGLVPAARHAAILISRADRRHGGNEEQRCNEHGYELNGAQFHGQTI